MHSGIILACIFLGADRCKEFIQHSCISLVVHPSVFLADFLHLMYLKHILFALMLQAMNFFHFFHILSATFIFPLYFPILMVKTSIFWRNPSKSTGESCWHCPGCISAFPTYSYTFYLKYPLCILEPWFLGIFGHSLHLRSKVWGGLPRKLSNYIYIELDCSSVRSDYIQDSQEKDLFIKALIYS